MTAPRIPVDVALVSLNRVEPAGFGPGRLVGLVHRGRAQGNPAQRRIAFLPRNLRFARLRFHRFGRLAQSHPDRHAGLAQETQQMSGVEAVAGVPDIGGRARLRRRSHQHACRRGSVRTHLRVAFPAETQYVGVGAAGIEHDEAQHLLCGFQRAQELGYRYGLGPHVVGRADGRIDGDQKAFLLAAFPEHHAVSGIIKQERSASGFVEQARQLVRRGPVQPVAVEVPQHDHPESQIGEQPLHVGEVVSDLPEAGDVGPVVDVAHQKRDAWGRRLRGLDCHGDRHGADAHRRRPGAAAVLARGQDKRQTAEAEPSAECGCGVRGPGHRLLQRRQ